ncbi:hypothetical protein [Neorhizobium sp. DT-125]|uniref:hypothetical protein n=1 Tax=Neorhizobium sp. DT-125 TaxID=3396163 RepID=UPI003F1D552B
MAETKAGAPAACRKAWIYAGWFLFVSIPAAYLIDFLSNAFGIAGAMAGVTLWLAHALPMLFLFKCPKCGASVYCRDGVGSLAKPEKLRWPAQQLIPQKACRKCGENHTVQYLN